MDEPVPNSVPNTQPAFALVHAKAVSPKRRSRGGGLPTFSPKTREPSRFLELRLGRTFGPAVTNRDAILSAVFRRLQYFSTPRLDHSRLQQPNRVDQCGRAQVRIPLRHRQVLMAHQFLHRPHCRTPHHEVRAERVTQDVHAGRHIRAVRGITNPGPGSLPRDRLPVVQAQHP